MTRRPVGVQVGATTSPEDLPGVVAEAERLGYGEIWLAEDYFELGGISSAALALGASHEVPVGLGVVAAAARHPAVTAMEFATLGRAFPGRFMAGIGHGAPGWVRQMGLQAASPLRSLREATDAVRRLLAGEEVTAGGEYVRLDRVELTHPVPRPIPLYLGVHGPASLRLSGELADGTVLGWFSSPGYVAWARDRIDEGRTRAGRTDAHELVALCVASVSDTDPEGARREMAAWARPMLAAMTESPQLRAAPPDIVRSLERSRETPGETLPADVLDEFTAAGDISTCRRTVERLLAAGADRVVLVPNPAGLRSTAAMVAQFRMLAPIVNSDEEAARPW